MMEFNWAAAFAGMALVVWFLVLVMMLMALVDGRWLTFAVCFAIVAAGVMLVCGTTVIK